MTSKRMAAGLAGLGATVCLALGASTGHAASDGKPLPGYWETTSKATLSKTKVERRCLVAADINKFLTNPQNSHYACTYPHRVVGGGRIDLKGSCVDKNGQTAKVSGVGAYTPTTFHMDLDIDTQIVGLPISGSGTTDAHRIGDTCPPDALRSAQARAEQPRTDPER